MTTKNKHHDYDLYEDVEKIKSALFTATQDVKGKAADMFSDSMEEIKDQTRAAKDSVAKYTSRKPFKSLTVALLVGTAIGYLLHK